MNKGTTSQAGPERPMSAITTRRARIRKESKGVYHNASGYSTRRIPSPVSSPSDSAQRNERYQPSTLQTADLGFVDYLHVQKPGARTDASFDNVIHQHGPIPIENSFFYPVSYTLASNAPTSPHQMFNGNDSQSPISGLQQTFDQDFRWTEVAHGQTNMASDIDDMHMSDLNFGSFDSLDSLGLSTPDTATSSMHSEEFIFPITEQTFGPSGTTDPMAGLAIPDEWYKVPQNFNSPSPGAVNPGSPQFMEEMPLDNEFYMPSDWNSYAEVYTEDTIQWPSPSTTLVPQQTPSPQIGESMTLTLNPSVPWNSQNQGGNLQFEANSGVVTFQQPPGPGYDTHMKRQRFLDTGQTTAQVPEVVTPSGESESGSWPAIRSYPPSSYAASHGSPHSHGSPASHPPSPSQDERECQHMFSSVPDAAKSKLPRGRQRGLTELEKKQARDVREAKACWACHISKTKCSPCSPGKPCEQCARLAGKRRFCLFECFNDPLESLAVLLIPPYLNGHFTVANVEQFVKNNVIGWGQTYMPVGLSWGYRRLINVEVVALNLLPNSQMRFHHQAEATNDMNTRPTLVRKDSPPLGIELASVDEMQTEYSGYVQTIVQEDIMSYVPIAYVDQISMLPERLLSAICSFYKATREQDNESDLLRRAIEMHVNAVILERSLTLDDESQSHVQQQLQEEYPAGSAPRCAQRQIKLAFYFLQEKRINRVLKDWGNMMWSTSNNISKDNEWATAFSVFLVMILVTDKILGSAYYFCEGNIKHRGREAISERRQFQKLVDLTEKEMFERCKEIFHWKFKTRKGGKEACNPIRDGIEQTFESKSKSAPVEASVRNLVEELRGIVALYDRDIRLHRSDPNPESPYTDAGRMACIFLDDFLSR